MKDFQYISQSHRLSVLCTWYREEFPQLNVPHLVLLRMPTQTRNDRHWSKVHTSRSEIRNNKRPRVTKTWHVEKEHRLTRNGKKGRMTGNKKQQTSSSPSSSTSQKQPQAPPSWGAVAETQNCGKELRNRRKKRVGSRKLMTWMTCEWNDEAPQIQQPKHTPGPQQWQRQRHHHHHNHQLPPIIITRHRKNDRPGKRLVSEWVSDWLNKWMDGRSRKPREQKPTTFFRIKEDILRRSPPSEWVSESLGECVCSSVCLSVRPLDVWFVILNLRVNCS